MHKSRKMVAVPKGTKPVSEVTKPAGTVVDTVGAQIELAKELGVQLLMDGKIQITTKVNKRGVKVRMFLLEEVIQVEAAPKEPEVIVPKKEPQSRE